MLTEIADDVFIRQSEFCLSNAVLVRGPRGILVIDPGVDGPDFDALTEDIRGLREPVLLGFATHPHWDHVLWDRRLGDVPRYGTATCATTAASRSTRIRRMAEQSAAGIELSLVGGIEAVPSRADRIPWDGPAVRIIEHNGHAPGHAGLLIEHAGVLVAGDMLSDVEIPLLDPEGDSPWRDYRDGLARLAAACSAGIAAVVPGHGGVARAEEVASRFERDRAYLEALTTGVLPSDPRVGPEAAYGQDWLPEAHERNLDLARRENNTTPESERPQAREQRPGR